MTPAITVRKSLVLLLGASLLGGWVRPPSATAAPTVTLEADARVAAASPSSNYGAATTLEIDNSPLTESFVRFSVSGVDGAVTSARLRAWVTNASANGPEIYLSGTGWDESTVNWNNKPARLGGLRADAGSLSASTWAEWDVTSAVTGNGTYSFNLVADSSDGTDLATKEAGSNRPQLVVTVGSTLPPPPPATGIINTVAGTGTSGFSGDGGPATSARLNAPRTMAADGAGNMYIIDTGNHRARKVDTAGRITTIAGTGTAGFSGDGGPGTSARLNTPHGIAVDGAGNVYIADPPNQRIRKVDTSGQITTVAGNGSSGYNGDGIPATSARLNYPKGVEIGPDGLLYIADNNNHRVRKVDAAGMIRTVAGTGSSGFSGDGGPATAARLAEPRNIAFGPDGSLYIVDQVNDRIRRVSPGGTITTFASGFSLPRDVAVDGAGNVYVADESHKKVYRVDPAGRVSTFAGTGSTGDSGDGGAATAARLNNPRGVAWDPSRSAVLIADTNNHRVKRVANS
jgi:sugar lactone lactonase YvrE